MTFQRVSQWTLVSVPPELLSSQRNSLVFAASEADYCCMLFLTSLITEHSLNSLCSGHSLTYMIKKIKILCHRAAFFFLAGCPEAGHMSQVTDVQGLSVWILWFLIDYYYSY